MKKFFIILVCLFSTLNVFSEIWQWKNVSGLWDDPTNWKTLISPTPPPPGYPNGPTEEARFFDNNDSEIIVTLSIPITLDSLIFANNRKPVKISNLTAPTGTLKFQSFQSFAEVLFFGPSPLSIESPIELGSNLEIHGDGAIEFNTT